MGPVERNPFALKEGEEDAEKQHAKDLANKFLQVVLRCWNCT